jgi:hypothetical protein
MTSPPDTAGIRVVFASVPHRESVVAELWVGNDMLAELRREGGSEHIQIYSPPTADMPWDHAVDDLVRALDYARRGLGP